MKRRLPPLKSLLVLESVARTGSVNAAADELAVTHSAVSKQLAALEDWLGTPLFAEKRRGMIPTNEVGRLAEAARLAFDQLQVAVDAIRPDAAAPVPLRVIAPATFAMRWLIPRLPDFRTPGQPIDITVRPTHTPENWLDIPFDVAIRRGGTIPPLLHAMPLFKEELSLVVAADLAAETPETGGAAAARWLHAVGFVEAVTRPGELRGWIARAGLAESLAENALRFPHFYVAMEAMLAGRGALVTPSFLVEELVARGDVVEPWPALRMPGPLYRVVIDPQGPEVEAADVFATWLVDVAAAGTALRAGSQSLVGEPLHP